MAEYTINSIQLPNGDICNIQDTTYNIATDTTDGLMSAADKVKLNNEYGVLDETGTTKVNIGYDKIGFNEQSNIMEAVCIIRNVSNNHDGIVVCKDNKYGIVDLETGKMIIKCEVDKIYSKTYDSEENKYYVEIKETEIDLQEYIEYINTTTVITN